MAREYHGKCHIRRLCSWNWGFFIPKSDYQKGMIKIPDKLGRILQLNPFDHLWPNDFWCTNVGEVIWIHWPNPIWIQSIVNWTSTWNVLTYATVCRTYGHEFDVLWWMCLKQPGPTGLGLGECWGFHMGWFFIPKSDYQKGMIKIADKLGRIWHLNPFDHLWPNDVWCTNVGEVIWIHWTIPFESSPW